MSSAAKENVVAECVSQSMIAATTLDLKTGDVTVNGAALWLRGMRRRASFMTSGDQHGFEYIQSCARKTATVALVSESRVCGQHQRGECDDAVQRRGKKKGHEEVQTLMP